MVELNILKGLRPSRKLGGNYNSGGFNTYPIANGYATAIGEGDPVKLSGGVIQLADNDSAVLGVFKGVKYIDPVTAQLRIEKNFVAATSSKGGVKVEGGAYAQPLAMVCDDPNQTYSCQTTEVSVSALSAGIIGRSFRLSAIGSVVGGQSQAVLDIAASVGTSAGDGHMVTILGLYQEPNVEFATGSGTSKLAVEVKLSNPGIVGEL